MTKAWMKKLACVGLLAMTATLAGCGSTGKVGIVDVQRARIYENSKNSKRNNR